MKYKVGDKVIMPLANDAVGKITDIKYSESVHEHYYIINSECNDLPFRYYEQDLKPFIQYSNQEYIKLPDATKKKVLIVEDGSVDIDKLEEDGFYVIVYRQGAKPPIFLEV